MALNEEHGAPFDLDNPGESTVERPEFEAAETIEPSIDIPKFSRGDSEEPDTDSEPEKPAEVEKQKPETAATGPGFSDDIAELKREIQALREERSLFLRETRRTEPPVQPKVAEKKPIEFAGSADQHLEEITQKGYGAIAERLGPVLLEQLREALMPELDARDQATNAARAREVQLLDDFPGLADVKSGMRERVSKEIDGIREMYPDAPPPVLIRMAAERVKASDDRAAMEEKHKEELAKAKGETTASDRENRIRRQAGETSTRGGGEATQALSPTERRLFDTHLKRLGVTEKDYLREKARVGA